MELAKKVKQLRKLEAEAAELMEQAETLKDEIKAEMRERGVEGMRAGVFSIRYARIVSNRFDTASFKEENEELYRRYLKRTETRRFVVA